MQSPRSEDKERKQENDSPTKTIEEEQKGELFGSATPPTAVKNKKRVHYPYTNGELPVTDSVKTDSQPHDISSPGINKSF
jgi:hypothetical protein